MPRWRRSRARSRNCARSIRRPAWSSTIRKRSGRRPSRPCARPWRGRRPGKGHRRRSASPTSARPRSSGTGRPAAPSTMPSSGRTGARRTPARRCGRTGTRPRSRRAPGCCSILISPPPRSPGCSTTSRVRARRRAQGRLAFGTVDSFLLWRLTGGKVHATDATNAARTLLLDIRHGEHGTPSSANLFDVPDALLPQVRDCAGDFGTHRTCSAGRSAFWGWPATSRRRRWGRAASRPA